ncbi:MAG: glycosyl hydrolase [Promethearchaeota archaeon]
MNDENTGWKEWKDPDKKYRPMVRWWLPGMDVEEDELLRELAELDGAGIGGVELQAFLIGTPSPNNDLKHRFAPNPFYYDIIEAILKESRKREMVVDLTISSSWPPGGTWVNEENSLQTLLMGTTIVNGPQHASMPVPPIKLNTFYKKQKFLKKIMGSFLVDDITADRDEWFSKFKPIATVAVQPIKKSTRIHFLKPSAIPLDVKTAMDITENVTPDGRLEWDVPDGTWQIFCMYAGPSGMKPLSDSRSDPNLRSLVVDMFDKKRVMDFVSGHLDPGADKLGQYYGNTLRALFTDSQEIGSEWFWTDSFLEEFKRRRGYDVRKYMPVNFVPNRDNQFTHVVFQNTKPCFDFPGGAGRRIRHDWEETISDLFAENYCGAVSEWGKEKNIKHRIQTYGIRADLLKAYGRADIPETEQLFAGGVLDFLKLAGSAGIIYQKPIVSSESLVWMGRDYMTTPLKWKVAADRLFISGINQMIYHGFPYFAPWKNFPGHYPWSPPKFSSNLNRNNPFWQFFHIINGYVTRCQSYLQRGTTSCNVGIYYPHFNYDYKYLHPEDLGAGYLEGYDGKPLRGIVAWWMTKVRSKEDKTILRQQELGASLMARGYFYTHLNDEVLLAGRLEDGKLEIGDAKLDAIILPGIEAIPVQIARKLQAIANQGVKVLFIGTTPGGQPGFFNYKENDLEIKRIVDDISNDFHVIEYGTDPGLYLWQTLMILPGIEFSKPSSEIQFIHKSMGDEEFYFLRSASQNTVNITIGFREAGKKPFFLDPWTGGVEPVLTYTGAGDASLGFTLTESKTKISIPITFAPYGSKVLLFRREDNFPKETHVIRSDLDVFERDGKLFSYADTEGTFNVYFNDGTLKKVKVLIPPPVVKTLEIWDLEATTRDASGTCLKKTVQLESLVDLQERGDFKYFSGPFTYKKTIILDDSFINPNINIFLNLGKVHDVAVITINGEELPPLIAPPYNVDITDVARTGDLTVEVRVISTMRNLLVGYAKAGKKTWKHHKRASLMPMGMIGPVTITARRIVEYT